MFKLINKEKIMNFIAKIKNIMLSIIMLFSYSMAMAECANNHTTATMNLNVCISLDNPPSRTNPSSYVFEGNETSDLYGGLDTFGATLNQVTITPTTGGITCKPIGNTSGNIFAGCADNGYGDGALYSGNWVISVKEVGDAVINPYSASAQYTITLNTNFAHGYSVTRIPSTITTYDGVAACMAAASRCKTLSQSFNDSSSQVYIIFNPTALSSNAFTTTRKNKRTK
jgi:hypothetical protein